MNNILVISESGDEGARLTTLLEQLPQTQVQLAADADGALSCAQGADAALALLVLPLSQGLQALCRALLDNTYATVAVLGTPQEVLPDGVIAVEDTGALLSLVQALLVCRRRFLGLRTENEALHNKLSELRLVNRAKCVLIQYLGIGEAQAHRYMEKQAMDRRVSRTEIAREILKTYEL